MMNLDGSLRNGDEHRAPSPPEQSVPQATRYKPRDASAPSGGGEDVKPGPPRRADGLVSRSFPRRRHRRRRRGDEQVREGVAEKGALLGGAIRGQGRLPGRLLPADGAAAADEEPQEGPAAAEAEGRGGAPGRAGDGCRRRALGRQLLELVQLRH